MRIEFITDTYEFVHGKKPRGMAGGWAFGHKAYTDMDEIFWVHGVMTYGEAKKKATEWAKAMGYATVYPQT
jgi:hypothetical protein